MYLLIVIKTSICKKQEKSGLQKRETPSFRMDKKIPEMVEIGMEMCR